MNLSKYLFFLLIGILCLTVIPVMAQDETGPTGGCIILPQPEPKFEGDIGRTFEDSTQDKPKMLEAPEGAPNVLLILLDDMGYGQVGTFGSPVETPALDRVADNGIRYTQFHTTALCSPTRAALLTGRNHHSCATGVIMELGTPFPGYNTAWPASCASIAEILKLNGYNTAAFGKWHNTPDWETSVAGPFDRWPTGMGFEYFYGFIGGDTSQWEPNLYENTAPVELTPELAGTHLTTILADEAIQWIKDQHVVAPDKPFFVYFSTGATHAPHHAPEEWIKKFEGKFDMGWDKYREETFERQKDLGVIPKDTLLTQRPDSIPSWDSLTPDQQKLYSRMMEVFAAFTAHTDYEIGRVIDAIEEMGELDNTIIIYIAGDNGSSAEGGLTGSVNEMRILNGIPETLEDNLAIMDELGGPMYYNHFPCGWAWAMDTPFQWTKQVASHFGGTRNGLAISWPEGIRDKGGIRYQFHHVIDIVPTILEAANIVEPVMVNGVPQKPVEGVSMVYTFDKANENVASKHKTQYFEMFCNRAIYHNGWIASSMASIPWEGMIENKSIDELPWELYYLPDDFSQAVDLAEKNPEKLRALQDLWWAEAAKYNVLPLDGRKVERFALENRPSLTAGRTVFTYYDGNIRIPEGGAPDLKNKSFSITAEVNIPEEGAEGIILTQGGRFGGWGLYIQDGKLTYVHNFAGIASYFSTSDKTIPPGEHALTCDFEFDGGKMGAGGNAILYMDGEKIGEGRIEKTIPLRYSLYETFDVGADTGTPVVETYKLPFNFTGELKKVTVELK